MSFVDEESKTLGARMVWVWLSEEAVLELSPSVLCYKDTDVCPPYIHPALGTYTNEETSPIGMHDCSCASPRHVGQPLFVLDRLAVQGVKREKV